MEKEIKEAIGLLEQALDVAAAQPAKAKALAVKAVAALSPLGIKSSVGPDNPLDKNPGFGGGDGGSGSGS